MKRREFAVNTCKTCVYYNPHPEKYAQDRGYCQFNPPVTHQFGTGEDITTAFPDVSENDYCGKWKRVCFTDHVRAIRDKVFGTMFNTDLPEEEQGEDPWIEDKPKQKPTSKPTCPTQDDDIPF